jgi:hypothetical protein
MVQLVTRGGKVLLQSALHDRTGQAPSRWDRKDQAGTAHEASLDTAEFELSDCKKMIYLPCPGTVHVCWFKTEGATQEYLDKLLMKNVLYLTTRP